MKLPISPGNFVNIEQGDIPLRGVYVVKYHAKFKKNICFRAHKVTYAAMG